MVKYVEECLAHDESSVDVGDAAAAADKTTMMVTMTMMMTMMMTSW